MSDRIDILIAGAEESAALERILEKHGDYVQQETLADHLRLVDGAYPGLAEVKMGAGDVLRPASGADHRGAGARQTSEPKP